MSPYPRRKRPAKQPVSPKTIALDGPFEHVWLHTRGIRLHAAVAGDPSNPLVVLVHGTFGAWVDFRHVIAPLAARGFHVAAVDMRGYGMSDKPPARAGDPTRIAVGDIAGAVTALGHDRAHIVGHDTGGALAWVFAGAYPERTASLVSVSAAHPGDMRAHMRSRPWELMFMLVRSAVGRLPIWLHQACAPFIPQVWRRELALNTAPGFAGTLEFDDALRLRIRAARIDNALRGIVRNTRMLTASRQQRTLIDAPTLLLHPRQSVWDRIDARASQRLASAPVVDTVQGSKNVPQVENPEGFVDKLAAFFA